MKYLLLIGILIFSGCATDTAYKTVKTIYIGGKKIVIASESAISPKTMAMLKKIDQGATSYNNVRTEVKSKYEKKDVE